MVTSEIYSVFGPLFHQEEGGEGGSGPNALKNQIPAVWITFGMIYACLKDYVGINAKCLAFAGCEDIVMVSLRVTDVAKT